MFSIQFNLTELQPNRKLKKQGRQEKQQVWSPPPSNYLKINIDGAFRQALRSGGWGFTIRNDRGDMLLAGAGNLLAISDPLHAKTLALLHTVQEVSRMRC